MRTDPRYTRVRNIITAEDVPRLHNGGIALCHVHQRSTANAGSFNEYLIKRLKIEAGGGHLKIGSMFPGVATRCPRCADARRYYLASRNRWKCKRCGHQYSDTSGGVLASMKLPRDKMLKVIEAIKAGESNLAIAKRLQVNVRSVWYIKARVTE